MGDFNENLLGNQSHVANLMQQQGYKQCVQDATTENGTLLDHVYVRGLDEIVATVIPTYYSYHKSVKISFNPMPWNNCIEVNTNFTTALRGFL